jgi:uncharacterized membrane protein
MAGIGFRLKKLIEEDSLSSIGKAYMHASFITSGPWLFTIIALQFFTFYARGATQTEDYQNFNAIIAYNFAFSLIFTSPFFIVTTRYLADRIFVHDMTRAPSILAASMAALLCVQAPIGIWFYFGYANLSATVAFHAYLNLLLLSSIWLVGVFLTVLKEYAVITLSFCIGMAVGIISGYFLREYYSIPGLLMGFNIGLTVVVFGMVGEIISEYNFPINWNLKEYFSYYKKYADIAITTTLYNLGLWFDKIVLCFADNAVKLESNLIINFDYFQGMFLAYFAIIPVIAIFFISVETNFFNHYHTFYRDILSGVPYSKIKENHASLKKSLIEGARTVVILQGVICFFAIASGPKLFEFYNIDPIHLQVFSYGVLGGFFHIVMLFITIIMSYFDDRRGTFWIYFVFCFSNGIFSYLTMKLGIQFHGMGYFFASMLACVVSLLVLFRHIEKLPYYTFDTITKVSQLKDLFKFR